VLLLLLLLLAALLSLVSAAADAVSASDGVVALGVEGEDVPVLLLHAGPACWC
jgi:hypothetical protein